MQRKAMIFLFCGLLLAGIVPFGAAQQTQPAITIDDLRTHVSFLASDALEGRGSGTEGNRKAAEYIANLFEQFGLEPYGDDSTYFQHFQFTSGVELGQDNALSFSGSPVGGMVKAVADADFRPFGFSSSEETSGPVVFAGYGMSVPDDGYDDYDGIDVSGKIVVVLRYSPKGDDPHSEFARHATFRSKARFAREQGAAALIIVTGPADDPDDELVRLGFDQTAANSGIPVVTMKAAVLDRVLNAFGTSTAALQDSINDSGKPVALELDGVTASLRTDVHTIRSTTANILGFLPGAAQPGDKGILVIGAHMDHLGYGGPGSGSLDPDNHAIHNGADDNASGTAGLLELAESFSSEPAPARGILFIAFSGEELGTLGSAYYVSSPAIPLDQTAAMINMDMIGRLQDSTLTVYGTGTATEWEELVDRINAGQFELKKVPDGFGPSDHAQFYGKDIPVLFFFTGTHDDYHKPSDDWEKINYAGEQSVVQLVKRIATVIINDDASPVFARVQGGASSGEGGRVSFRVTLGVVPDYASEEKGMKIGGVRPDGPAEKAGLKGGDILVGMKGKEILNIYDYMAILGTLSVGDVVEIEVLRDGEPMKFSAVMSKRD